MLTDSDKSIRELAVQKISFARKNNSIERKFSVSLLNVNADSYVNVATWEQENTTEPPLVRHIADERLKEYASTKSFELQFERYSF
jgi:hypothetical protein